jgi:FlaA1/EpsC-like NDP-sugar epimerase
MRRVLLLLVWLVTDVVLMVGAYAAAYFLRVGLILSTDFPIDKYLQTVFLVAPFWLVIMGFLGIFRLLRVQSSPRNLCHILFSCIMALALYTLAYYFLFNNFFSRKLLVYAALAHVLLTVVWHLAFDQWQRRILRRKPAAYPVLVIGANRDAERVIRLLEERQSPLKPVAVLDSQGTSAKEIAGVPVRGKLNKLEDVIREEGISHLLQCADLEHTINLLSLCRQHGITYMLLPSVLGIVGVQERIDEIEGQPVTAVHY